MSSGFSGDPQQMQAAMSLLQSAQATNSGRDPNAGLLSSMSMLRQPGVNAGSSMLSDKSSKDHISKMPPDDLLSAVRSWPIDRWNYKGDDTPHVGTYTQNFYSSLGLPHRSTIDNVDMFGVLSGAIQALDKKVNKGKS